MKLNRILATSALVGCVSAGVLGLGHHQASASLKMIAGPAVGKNGQPEVRFLWIPNKGWLPSGGVNLYRISESGRVKVNSTPIVAQEGFLKPNVLAALRESTSQNQESFGTSTLKKVSSRPVFDSMKGLVGRMKTDGTPEQEMRQKINEEPKMAQHMKSIKPAEYGVKTTKTIDATALRGQIAFQALANFDLATKLGLAFVDHGTPSGGRVQYAIRGIAANGQEDSQDLDSITVDTSSSNSKPPTPTDLDGTQIDQDSVDLHWEFLDDKDASQLGLPTYRVERVAPGKTTAEIISTAPIIIAFQDTKTGDSVAPVSTFRDDKAPLGGVKYRVYMVDSLGRRSDAAEVVVAMEDLRTPPPVSSIFARVNQTSGTGTTFGKQGAPVRTFSSYVFFVGRSTRAGKLESDLIPTYRVYRDDAEGSAGTQAMPLTPVFGDGNLVSIGDLAALYGSQRVMKYFAKAKDFNPIVSVNSAIANMGGVDAKADIQSMLAGVGYIIDANPPADHYYQYRVKAVFQQVGRESIARSSSSVGVPLTTLPPKPESVAGTFSKGQGKFGFFDETTQQPRKEDATTFVYAKTTVANLAKKVSGEKTTKNAKPLVDEKNFKHAKAPVLAGTVKIQWQPVTQTTGMRYAVYRAPASGLAPVSNVSFTQGVGLGGKPTIKPVKTKAGLTMQYFFDLPVSVPLAWVKLGETKDTKWEDPVSRSHAMRYAYRIVALNRWGVSSDYSSIQRVTVPATLPPSIPSMIAVSAVPSGGVAVVCKPNRPEEQVTKYVLVRKQISDAPSSNGGSTVGGSTGGGTVGGAKLGQGIGPSIKDKIGASGPKADLTKLAMAKFGATPKGSAHSNFAKTIAKSNIKDSAGKVGKIPITPELVSMLDLASYKTVASIDVANPGTAPDTLVINDTTGVPNVEYLYRVIALNSDKIGSDGSQPMEGVAPKIKADPPTNAQPSYVFNDSKRVVTLTWKAPITGATGYFVKRRQTNVSTTEAPLLMTTLSKGSNSAAATVWEDPYIRTGQTYEYQIIAIDDAGNVSDPLIVSYGPIPPVPSNPDSIDSDSDDGNGNNEGNKGGETGGLSKPPADPGEYFSGTLPSSDDALFGKAYRTKDNRIAFVVESASYRASRLTYDKENQRVWMPGANQKLLVLNFAVQNISKEPIEVGYQTLFAKVVNADGSLSEPEDHLIGLENDPWKQKILQPKQVIRGRMAIVMDGNGAAKSVMIDGGTGMRSTFDLKKNTVSKFSEPVGNPKDSSGYSTAEKLAGRLGVQYPFNFLDASVESISRSSAKFGDETLEDGNEYVVVTLRVSNGVKYSHHLGYQTFTLNLFDADGQRITSDRTYHGSKNEPFETDLAAEGTEGDTRTVRYIFQVKRGATFRRLEVKEGDSRTVSYPAG